MKISASSVQEYLQNIQEEHKEGINKLLIVIRENLPAGFEEVLSYGMIGFVVPHAIYPSGYHCDPKLPLPFMNLASQKNFIAFYHMGIYSNEGLLKWFQEEYAKFSQKKLDMGKSCMRYKKTDDIPYDLIGQLVSKITVANWIEVYENQYKNNRKKSDGI